MSGDPLYLIVKRRQFLLDLPEFEVKERWSVEWRKRKRADLLVRESLQAPAEKLEQTEPTAKERVALVP